MGELRNSILDKRCDLETISEVLNELCNKDVCSSEEMLPLIRNVLPVYPSLPKHLQSMVRNICASNYIFVSLVIEYAKELGQKKEKGLYLGFLEDVLRSEPSCLFNYIKTASRSSVLFVKSLLFGSRLYNALAEDLAVVEYLQYMRSQWEYVFEKSETYEKLHLDLFTCCLQLNVPIGTAILIEDFVLSKVQAWNVFVEILKRGSFILQVRMFKSYLAPYFDSVATEKCCSTIYTLLSQLPFEIPVLAAAANWESPYFKLAYLASLSQQQKYELFQQLLLRFEQIDMSSDHLTAELLVMVLNNLNEDVKDSIARDPLSLNFVNVRLCSEDNMVRERTMFIANKITGNKIKFESDFIVDTIQCEVKIEPTLHLPLTRRLHTKRTNEPTEIRAQLHQITLSDDDGDSDDETEDNPKDILFLKDLLIEFELAAKNNASEVRLLKQTVKLVRQKKDFPTEVSFYSTHLLKLIATLSNQFDDSSFEQWKLNAMVSILVVCPSKIDDLYTVLFNNELSLQQRMIILTAAALSARELRGYEDSFILQPEYDFPTRMLPFDRGPHLPNDDAKKSLDFAGINALENVWRSKRLDVTTIQAKPNNFREYATNYFYPLALAWFNGIDLGTFDKLFKKHYVMMLEIIITCASPHHELDAMQQMMQRVLSDCVDQDIAIS